MHLLQICGQISMYNDTKLSFGLRILPNILVHSALVQGLIVGKYKDEFPQAFMQLYK
jgi:Putative NADP-dependent oxidoreductases